MNQTNSTLSTDEMLRLLADPRRRAILRYLGYRDREVVDLETLLRSMATEEVTHFDDAPTPEQLRVSLRHVHLPKLADAGLVNYDPEGGTLRYRSDDNVESLLQFVGENLPQPRRA